MYIFYDLFLDFLMEFNVGTHGLGSPNGDRDKNKKYT